MLKLLPMIVLTIVIVTQAVPGYCAISQTTTFNLSVTIPPHVTLSSNNLNTSSNNQLVQTETVIRNDRSINVTSIVVP